MTKQEVINRIETIAEIANSHDNGYHYEVVVSEWVKYGKDRTYFSIVETRDGSKHYVKKSYGYFDNNADTYVNGRGDANINYDFGGNNKVEDILAARAAEEAAKAAAEAETTETVETTTTEIKEEPEMKKYCFSKWSEGWGSEVLYFEDEKENAVIVEAASPEEAEKKLLRIIDDEYLGEVETFDAEELQDKITDYPFHYFVEWYPDADWPHWFGKPQCIEG